MKGHNRLRILVSTEGDGSSANSKASCFAPAPVNPHTIRHTTAMHLLRSGNDINMVSYWLGHADLNTTHIYLEIDMQTKRKMLDRATAPMISQQAPWHKPDLLDWLNQLTRRSELCAVNHFQNAAKPTESQPNST